MTTQLLHGRKKWKKAEIESTKKSIESLADYAAKKSQIMDENVEKKRAKEELAEKLMSAQLEGVQEKNYFRDMKFFNDPMITYLIQQCAIL